jgi:predicted dehydrogenase
MALRFGLLGTGYWAAETQGAALAAHPQAEFVGVWGRDPAKAAALADRYGIRAYGGVDALLADVDAVAIALPPDIQAELAVRAAEAGRHLLLDKPLALTTADADRVMDAVERSGVGSVIFFTNRFFDNIEAFLRHAEGGHWDGARITKFVSIFQPGNPYGASPWRREKGGLWDIGPHALSVILPVLGPVTQVAALDGPHDTVHVLLRHESGAASSMSLTLDAPPAAVTEEFTFYGAGGQASVPAGDGGVLGAFGRAIDQLARGVASGDPAHPCDVRFGREVVATLAAADTARTVGHTVRL